MHKVRRREGGRGKRGREEGKKKEEN